MHDPQQRRKLTREQSRQREPRGFYSASRGGEDLMTTRISINGFGRIGRTL